jgi:type VI secretion system protein ImpL
MNKRVVIGIIAFVVFMALVVGGAYALHFEGMRFVLFIVILGLLGALTTIFFVWYLNKAASAQAGPNTPDAINLASLLSAAHARIRQANRPGVKSLAALPLVYVIGAENCAKTQTVLQSGLEPELLAGNVYQDGVIVPTQLANIWLAGNNILVEAGGALLSQPGLWTRLIRSTLPARLGSTFSKDSRLPARSVLICVSIERILAPNTTEQIRGLAQMLNERLRTLSQTLGITLPVYVLFTKLDTIGPFADYVGRLSDDEVKFPIGSLLSSLDGGSGLYLEQATGLIGTRLDQLLYGLSEFRLDILSRGGEVQESARAYEFPRDLRKLRAGIVSFLAEVARPSQIGVNPFLRGFFFAGMRARVIDDVLDVGPAQQQAPAPMAAGATRVFSIAAAQAPPIPTPQRHRATRKVPQWVFLPHLFSKILFADKSALETSRASNRTSFLKRALLAAVSAVLLLILLLFTVSFFRNRALEQRVATAAAAPVLPVPASGFATIADLTTLDSLRNVLAELDQYRKNGPPLLDRMGLYQGDALYPIACQAASNKFRALLLTPTQEKILARLRAVNPPPTPDADYSATYRPLKAYILTVSNPDPDSAQDTVEFLPAELQSDWMGSTTPPADVASQAQAQFTFYANMLTAANSCLAKAGGSANVDVVAHARAYLNGFQGFQHVYQSMLAAANRKVGGINFNNKFPGSVHDIIDNYTVQGAFSKDGFTFMQDAILHPDPYFRGEEWVLGPSSGPAIDRVVLSGQLRSAYFADYIQAWRSYLNKASFVPYQRFADAGQRLGALDSNTSAMLEFFSLISINTGVAAPEISSAFQAPQSVVPPSSPDNRFIAPSNQAYIQALQGLEGAVKNLTLNVTNANDPAAAGPVVQAAVAAEQAAENLRNGFLPDPSGSADKTSFALLEAPIESAKSLAAQAPLEAAGGGAKGFCAAIGPLLSKFPFNPQSSTDASTEEVAQVFAPTSGSFAQFTNTLHPFLSLQGSQFSAVPGSAFHINPAFLSFLNKAQKISSSLYPAGGTQPSLDFTLVEVKSPGGSDAALSIDGKQITSAGQSATFHWISSPSSRITLSTQKNTAPLMTGPWSVFHFGFAAPQVSPNRLKFFFSFNNQAPEVVFFDASGPGSPLLNPEFMKEFHCVSSVAR